MFTKNFLCLSFCLLLYGVSSKAVMLDEKSPLGDVQPPTRWQQTKSYGTSFARAAGSPVMGFMGSILLSEGLGLSCKESNPLILCGTLLGAGAEVYIGQKDENTKSRLCGGGLMTGVLLYVIRQL